MITPRGVEVDLPGCPEPARVDSSGAPGCRGQERRNPHPAPPARHRPTPHSPARAAAQADLGGPRLAHTASRATAPRPPRTPPTDRHPRHPPPLAPRSATLTLGPPQQAQAPRTPTNPPPHQNPGPAPRTREQLLGLPTHPRRT